MKHFQDDFDLLKELLKENPLGLTTKEIAFELKLNRNSVAKYLEILLISGQIEKRMIGPAKLYMLTSRVPPNEMVNFASECIFLLDSSFSILNANTHCSTLLKVEKGETLVGKSFFDLKHPMIYDETFLKDFHSLKDQKEIQGETCILTEEDLNYFSYKIFRCCFENGSFGFAIVFSNITKQKELENILKYRNKFEELLAEIASDFILIKKEEIEDLINKSLEKIGTFTKVDRTYIYLFSKNQETMNAVHSWSRPNAPDMPRELDGRKLSQQFPFWFSKFKNFEYLFVHKQTLPQKAQAEREYMEKHNISSIIMAPLIHEGNLVGLFGFTMVKKSRIWGEDLISLLGIMGRIYIQVLRKNGTLEDYWK